jgi:hypothetical protein
MAPALLYLRANIVEEVFEDSQGTFFKKFLERGLGGRAPAF